MTVKEELFGEVTEIIQRVTALGERLYAPKVSATPAYHLLVQAILYSLSALRAQITEGR